MPDQFTWIVRQLKELVLRSTLELHSKPGSSLPPEELSHRLGSLIRDDWGELLGMAAKSLTELKKFRSVEQDCQELRRISAQLGLDRPSFGDYPCGPVDTTQ